MRQSFRVGAAVLAVVLSLSSLFGCAPAETAGPRTVTSDEAQLLAVLRFRNFDAASRQVVTTLTDRGTELQLSGVVDYRSSTGFGVLSTSGAPAYLILWTDGLIAARPTDSSEAGKALGPPAIAPESLDGYEVSAMSGDSTLHSLLSIIIALGNDRPDNPLLLQSGGALWLREDTIGETPVTVFTGPSNAGETSAATASAIDPDASGARYWLDDTGLLLRVEVRLGAAWVTVDFADAGDARVNALFTEAP